MKILGVGFHSYEQVYAYLTRIGAKAESIGFDTKNTMRFCLERNLVTAASCRPKYIFVFGSPQHLHARGIQGLDYKADGSATTLQDPRKLSGTYTRDASLLSRIEDEARKNSVFMGLMTAIYKLPSSSKQKPATVICCKYLTGRIKRQTLIKSLHDLRLKSAQAHAVIDAVSTDLANTMIDHLKGMKRPDKAVIQAIAAKTGLHVFDMNYALVRAEDEAASIDKHVQNLGD